ncbi:hypothetical protein ACFWVT_20170 [Streptomyces cyaneofuscatus]|uniref:hypothetical protein n=1 Tax=Streptomyces cyaneofuscatus TaxID=66883 RepID=UPI003664E6CF|nr:hypothetical protein [Streptomyces sp. MT29]
MRRVISIALSTAVLSGGFVALASPASAACDDTGTKFSIINKKTVWKNTNLHSDWGKPGVTLRYDKTKSATLSASGTAEVGADAGVIFAKASASFGVTVGKSWTKGDTWSYSATVKKKKGKTRGRLMMQHEAKQFTAHKYKVSTGAGGTCKTKTVYKKKITAPVKKDRQNLWGIQYA